MTAKKYLKQVQTLDRKAEYTRRYLDRCKKDISLLQSPRYQSDRVQSNGRGDFSGAIDKLVSIMDQVNKDIDAYVNLRETIRQQIATFESPMYDILYMRYFEYQKDFGIIADKIGYSYPWTVQLHGKALKLFEERFLGG